jgi:glycosyltransferase involved in cell wall biosynthesis
LRPTLELRATGGHEQDGVVRILHVNKFLYRRGGAEAYMLDMAELQRAAGHEVAIFGMEHPENPALPLAETFPSYVEFQPAPATVSGKVKLAARMLHSRESERGMRDAVRAFQPDVVHMHNVYHQLSPSVVRAAETEGVPTVMTLHDYKLACPSYSLLDGSGARCTACVGGSLGNAVKRRCGGSLAAAVVAAGTTALHRRSGAYDHISRFLCPSEFLASVMRTAGVYPDRMHVLPNFVDEQPLQRTAFSRTVVFVGRLSWEKGVDVLLDAVPLLPQDVVVHIAGTGPEEDDLRRRADRHGNGRVVFHGRLPREGVQQLLAGAGVAVVPSRWYENQPLSVLEAFAAGVPVVASALGGLTELVENGVNGELVEADDAAGLAAAIERVLLRPDDNLTMGRAAGLKARSGHSAEQHVRALEDHYRAAQGLERAAAVPSGDAGTVRPQTADYARPTTRQ